MSQPSSSQATLGHADLALGPVELTVADLNRSLSFYRRVLGLKVQEQTAAAARLGTDTLTLLVLTEQPGARPAPVTSPGLFHYAVLLPERAELARWVRHAANLGLRIGQSDHLVSEAFYLNDPDGHGIEMYHDRPRDRWHWDSGQVRMASGPIDIQDLLAEPGADLAYTGLPAGAVMGHVHLRVTDLRATEDFYRHVLGFDVVARWPGALFVSAGAYHHHLGLNTWQSRGGQAAPDDAARLQRVNVGVPDEAGLASLRERLERAGLEFQAGTDHVEVRDPSGNRLRIARTRKT